MQAETEQRVAIVTGGDGWLGSERCSLHTGAVFDLSGGRSVH